MHTTTTSFEYVFIACRSNLMQMRTQHKDLFQEKHGVKLGFMSGFVKVATLLIYLL
jgi:pyruvate/2-oxoglutarate dehydrogenase complex dihydrolipoamide acyltransferase (E2) component